MALIAINSDKCHSLCNEAELSCGGGGGGGGGAGLNNGTYWYNKANIYHKCHFLKIFCVNSHIKIFFLKMALIDILSPLPNIDKCHFLKFFQLIWEVTQKMALIDIKKMALIAILGRQNSDKCHFL